MLPRQVAIDPARTSTSSSGGSVGASRSSTSSNTTNLYIENFNISTASISAVDTRSPTLKKLSISAGCHYNNGGEFTVSSVSTVLTSSLVAVTQDAGSISSSASS